MRYTLIILLLFFLSYGRADLPTSSVSYTLSGGRLGDNILMYVRAKSIAERYQLRLTYSPFPLAEHFVFHDLEMKNRPLQKRFSRPLTVKGEKDFDKKGSTHFILPYFSDFFSEQTAFPEFPEIYMNWYDPNLRKNVQKWVQLKKPLDLIYPKDPSRKSVALHIRYGSGQDDLATLARHPLKFPPTQYYANQLIKLYNYFDQPLEVFIFTDAKEPETVASNLESFLENQDITISYRAFSSQTPQAIFEDLFSLANFSCLVRSESSFSFLASLLKEYDIIIAPWHFEIHNSEVDIKSIEIQRKGEPFVTLQQDSLPL